MKTVVGLYSTFAEANKVKVILETEGYETNQIKVVDQSLENHNGANSQAVGGESFTQKVKGFFSNFAGHDETDHQEYASLISDGGALLSVTVPDEEAEETADLLYQHGATGIEGSTSGAVGGVGFQGGNDYNKESVASGEQVIPIVQEDLVVGKRQVDRGGVRIYSHIIEEPVSADISLHNERVVVERRAVDRAATGADFNNLPSVVEMAASGEEAVVGKTSRVVEEVSVGKQVSEHVEQIHDTVRHTEVDVEQLAGSTNLKRS